MEALLLLIAALFVLPIAIIVSLVRMHSRIAELRSENADYSVRLRSLEAAVAELRRQRPAIEGRDAVVDTSRPQRAPATTAEAATRLAPPAPAPPPPPATAVEALAAPKMEPRPRPALPATPPEARPASPLAPPRGLPLPAQPAAAARATNTPVTAGLSATAGVPRGTVPPPQPPPPQLPPLPPQPPAPFDWEGLIGVKLFSWIAGIALALGGIFFLRYSIQSGWLQPPVRMAIGLLTGVGLLVGCELRAARRYAVTANALDASGLVILFSTVFASHALWGLLNAFAAFALLIVLTVVAVLLSIRRNSVFVALLGLVGGFATPALLSSGQDNPIGLFGYLLLLNAGLAWVAYYKRWIVLVALSLALTTLYQWGWVFTFLNADKLPLATAIFLAFPVLAWVLFAARGDGAGEDADRFGRLAAVNASLPLLFALHVAAVPAYGPRFQVLFGFLFLVVAGLFAVARTRGPQELHAVGAVSTLFVFFTWWANQYPGMRPDAWRAVLAFVALFVAFYLAAGRAGLRRGGPFKGIAALAVLAAPLLLFMFPALAATEPAFSSPLLPFATLFVLMAAVAAYAIAEEDGLVFFAGSFMTLAAEAVWSSRYLAPERLLAALGIYAAFGLFYLGVPLVARRAGKVLRPEGIGAVVLLAAVCLLFFLSTGPVAGASLWGLALLLLLLNGAIFVEGSAKTRPGLAVAGTILSWLVLASWWASGALEGHAVPAMIVVTAFALATMAGHLWLDRSSGRDGQGWAESGTSLGLVGHLFLLFVASQPGLSNPPWPMLGVLLVLDLAVGVAALYARRGAQHVAAVVASQLVVITWTVQAGGASSPLVAMAAATVVAAFGMAWSSLARRTSQPALAHFDVGAAAAVLIGQFALVCASSSARVPPVAIVTAFHVTLAGGALALAVWTGWQGLALFAVPAPAVAAWLWSSMHPGPTAWQETLLLATPLYLLFVAYPLSLGRRLRTSREPHAAAVLASAAFFVVARESLVSGGFGSVLGALPLAQATLTAVLLIGLLRIEPAGARTLGRLALVAGTALAFITVAIPLQLENEWLTIGWALEGAALAWLFTRIPHRGLFWSALGLLVVVFVRLAMNPEVFTYQERGALRIFNWYLYTYATAAIAMLLAARWLSRSDDRVSGDLPRGSTVLSAFATALLFLLLNIEIADFYATGAYVAFNFSSSVAQNLTYTLGWAAFAVALLVVGIVIRSHPARLAAILLLTVTVLKGFLFDVARLGGLYRVMSFVGLAISLALVAIVLQRFVLTAKPGGSR